MPRVDADRQLRLSVGAYRGSPRPMVVTTIGAALCVASVVAALILFPPFVVFGLVLGPIIVISLRRAIAPLASRALVAAEQDRVRRLPYPVHGVFEAMSVPALFIRFDVNFVRTGAPVDCAAVYAAFAAVDADVRLEPVDAHRVAVWTARIPAFTITHVNVSGLGETPLVTDHRDVGPRTMRLLDEVLPRLHETFGLADVGVMAQT